MIHIDYQKLGLLPYQIDYITDKSRIKLYEKSRRIGITRTQALEDVIEVGLEGKYDVWFSSNNDLNGREYIRYCHQFVRGFALIVKELAGIEIVEENKVFSILFKNGKRITALSSSPEQIHGKGGKIILDEFARRDNQSEVWEAASPAALIWENPIRIISTHNGKSSLFYHFIKKIENGTLDWSHHRTTFTQAVAQGLADKVQDKNLSPQERQDYITQIKSQVANSTIWNQQFMCEPQDVNQTFLPYSLLDANAKADMLPFKKLHQCRDLYAGLDVGRKHNLSVLWVVERVSNTHYITRFVRTIQKADFPKQEKIVSDFMRLPNMRRLCIDATGLGIGLVDYLQKQFGTARIEGINLTQPSKERIAFRLQKALTDHQLDIPSDTMILDDFNSVKQDATPSGNVRLIADTNQDTQSHADYFWACALALEAISYAQGDPFAILTLPFQAVKKINFNSFLKGFKRD